MGRDTGGKTSRGGQGDEEPDVEKDRGDESIEIEIDGQPGDHGDHEGGQHRPAPGISADAKSQSRHQRADEPDHSHPAQPGQVITAAVTQRNEQHPEGHAEEVPFLVQGDRDDERDQDKPGDSDAPGYVDSFGVQREDLRRISAQRSPWPRRTQFSLVQGQHENDGRAEDGVRDRPARVVGHQPDTADGTGRGDDNPGQQAHQPDPSIHPGPHQDPHSANDQHDADDEEKHASARQSVATEGSPEVPGVPTVKAESPDSDDDERDPGGTHEHGSEYQLAQTPAGHLVRPWLHFTRRFGHDYRPLFLPTGCYARPYRTDQQRSVRSARRSRRTIAVLWRLPFPDTPSGGWPGPRRLGRLAL